MELKARSKFKSTKNAPALYYVLAVGVIITILGFALSNQNIFLALSMGLSTFALFFVLRREPREIDVALNDTELKLDIDMIPLSTLLAFSMVDLGDTIEFVLHSTNITQQFLYFYVDESSPALPEFITELAQFVPYNEELPHRDSVHRIMRRIDLV